MPFQSSPHPEPAYVPCGPGSVVYEIPGNPAPKGSRFAFARGPAENPQNVSDVVLSLPRAFVASFVGFMAEAGTIDREPTETELDAIMQAIGSMLVDTQAEVLERVAGQLIDTLSDGDKEAAFRRTVEGVAGRIVRRAVREGEMSTEEAATHAEMLRRMLEERAQGDEGSEA